MGFLYKTNGITPREAREVCQLHELIEESIARGPVPLELYCKIWREEWRAKRAPTDDLASQERNARRLVQRLRELGYVVVTHGDKATLRLDFSVDEALRAEVERWLDRAEAVRIGPAAEDDDEDDNDSRRLMPMAPLDAIKAAHRMGLAVRSLCRRFKITERRMLVLLRALKADARSEGRPRLEERRSTLALEQAFHLGEFKTVDGRNGSSRYGRVAAVARILDCHRDTARAFLERYDAMKVKYDYNDG